MLQHLVEAGDRKPQPQETCLASKSCEKQRERESTPETPEGVSLAVCHLDF